MTPYEAVYGRPPHAISSYTRGATKNQALDELLQERKDLLHLLKLNLSRAWTRMEQQANKKRRHVCFKPRTSWCSNFNLIAKPLWHVADFKNWVNDLIGLFPYRLDQWLIDCNYQLQARSIMFFMCLLWNFSKAKTSPHVKHFPKFP